MTLVSRHAATLPHEKFYHMEEYERRMNALRAGEYIPPPDDAYDPNADLKLLETTHKRRPVEQDTYMSKEQLMELRKVQSERIQVSPVGMCYLGHVCNGSWGCRLAR